MNINNKRLVEFLLGSGMDPNSLVDLLGILSVLIKRHGKMVYTKKYINEISKVDHNLGSIISVLYKVDKVTQKDIKDIIMFVKKNIDSYHKEFTINTSSKDKSLEKYINDKFNDSKIETKLQKDLGVKVSGEGWYFKKDLDLDLQKLLG